MESALKITLNDIKNITDEFDAKFVRMIYVNGSVLNRIKLLSESKKKDKEIDKENLTRFRDNFLGTPVTVSENPLEDAYNAKKQHPKRRYVAIITIDALSYLEGAIFFVEVQTNDSLFNVLSK